MQNRECREVQTEPLEVKERWTQHPATNMIASALGDATEQAVETEPKLKDKCLSEFLARAAPVCLRLLEETRASVRPQAKIMSSTNGVTEAVVSMSSTVPLLRGRHVRSLRSASVSASLLLAAYTTTTTTTTDSASTSR